MWKSLLGKIIENSAVCLNCLDQCISKGRHDLVMCSCGRTGVDGGKDYIRRLGAPEDRTETSRFESDLD